MHDSIKNSLLVLSVGDGLFLNDVHRYSYTLAWAIVVEHFLFQILSIVLGYADLCLKPAIDQLRRLCKNKYVSLLDRLLDESEDLNDIVCLQTILHLVIDLLVHHCQHSRLSIT